MQARTIILSVLGGGPLLGLAMGLAADPHMVQPREPGWHKAQPDPIFTDTQSFVDAGPQDLSPAWSTDRMPTWKRRAAERQAAADAARIAADTVPPDAVAEEEPGDDGAAAVPVAPQDDASIRVTNEAAAADSDASGDARTAAAPAI
jgi:hypothetical protein